MAARSDLRWVALALASVALLGVVTDPGPTWGSAQPAADVSFGSRPPAWHRGALAPTPSPRSLAGRIRIPSIGVDARLVPLGLAADGSLAVPVSTSVAGWYQGGPFPGESGAAVVVGHVDSWQGPGVFFLLRELQPGALVIVLRAGADPARFRVTQLAWFAKSAFPTERVYTSTDSPTLRLITCGGAFDRATGHYLENLIVFALPIS